jgi:hypothetical protein
MFRRGDRRAKDAEELDAGLEEEAPEAGVAAGADGGGTADLPEDMDADLESQAADYMADNDEWLYGPGAPAILELLDRLEEVGPDDAGMIADDWKSAPKSDRDAARKSVRKLTEADEDLTRNVQMAREAIGAWLAVAAEYPEYVKAVPDWARVCTQVSEAAFDAATAIILEQTLEEIDYQALFLPWTEAVERYRLQLEVDEIEGVEVVEGDEEEDEGSDEVEAEGEFGPNTDVVTDFLNRLWLLTPDEVTRLVSGWQEAPPELLEHAHESLHDLVDEDEGWRDQVRAAQEKVSPWLNGGRLVETASFMGSTGVSTTRRMAGPALADAVAALVVGDLLDPEDAEALYAPWFNLVGAPPLPVSDADGEGAGSDGPKK